MSHRAQGILEAEDGQHLLWPQGQERLLKELTQGLSLKE